MNTQITFLRHGENKPYSESVPKDVGPSLSKKGVSQAKKTAVYLRDFKFDRIYCSNLARAIQTAEEIKKYQRCKISYHKEFAEVNMIIYDCAPEDKRKFNVNTKRMNSAFKLFKKILKENNGKKILIVAHGNIIRGILGMCLGFSLRDAPHFDMANCSISTLIFENEKLVGIPQICFGEHHIKIGFKDRLSNYHERIEYYSNLYYGNLKNQSDIKNKRK